MPSLASKLTAVATGDWDDNTTWDGVHPGCYDSICIPVGIVVTIIVMAILLHVRKYD